MHAELLSQRVVEIIESAALPHLDAGALVAALAVVLAGAGLVIVRDYALGNGDSLPLLVAEPFPRVEASLGVVPALGGVDDALAARLRRFAEHPAVDGLVVVNAFTNSIPRPRSFDGITLHAAMIGASPGEDARRTRQLSHLRSKERLLGDQSLVNTDYDQGRSCPRVTRSDAQS